MTDVDGVFPQAMAFGVTSTVVFYRKSALRALSRGGGVAHRHQTRGPGADTTTPTSKRNGCTTRVKILTHHVSFAIKSLTKSHRKNWEVCESSADSCNIRKLYSMCPARVVCAWERMKSLNTRVSKVDDRRTRNRPPNKICAIKKKKKTLLPRRRFKVQDSTPYRTAESIQYSTIRGVHIQINFSHLDVFGPLSVQKVP